MNEDIDIFICKYCGKVCKNANSLRNHERLCKENPDRQEIKSNLIEYNRNRDKYSIRASNQYIKAQRLGLPKPIVSIETRKKISEASSNRKWTTDMKKKHSAIMRKAVLEHASSYNSSNINGRVKKIEYNGYIFDSKWEVEVAKYLDKNSILWSHPTVGFEYKWNDKTHLYFPDFYLTEYDIYIEVKGFIRERDICKWRDFRQTGNSLLVILREDIKLIRDNKYIIYDKINTEVSPLSYTQSLKA